MEIFGHHLSLIVRTGGVFLLPIFAFLWFGSPLRANDTQRRVVMLHAVPYSNPNIAATSNAARERLLERLPQGLLIDADFLGLSSASDPGHEMRTVNILREKYAHMPPDVVMTFGPEALPFIVKHRDTVAPGIPVVFTGSRQRTMRPRGHLPT